MPDVSFTVKEIDKIGLVCPACKSEIVIPVSIDQAKVSAGNTATAPHKCPACFADAKPFARYSPDWLEWMETLKSNEDADSVRLYFKEK